MKCVSLCLVIVALVCVAYASSTREAYEQFKVKFGRHYNAAEDAKRFHNFAVNMRKAEQLAKENPYAQFGEGPFADMDAEEFRRTHLNLRPSAPQEVNVVMSEADLKATASKLDWRDKGVVTAIKDQGHCGDCWAFGSTANFESQWALAGKGLVSLSEQMLVSCDTYDDGCKGGSESNAVSWVTRQNQGAVYTMQSYPYTSGTGVVAPCNKTGKVIGAYLSSMNNLPHNEDQLASFLTKSGPFAAMLAADPFQTYRGGILTSCNTTKIDHLVTFVGFDTLNTPPYWIIKNSWGTRWGESGYIRIGYGTNQCLVTYAPTSVVVRK